MYLQGNLVGMLESVAKQICPSHHISSHGASPFPKKELTFNCNQQVCKKPVMQPAKRTTTKKIQAVDVFNIDNPTNVVIPGEFGSAFNHITDKYVNAIASTASFDTLQPCAVCDKAGHTFDDCPVLQNVEFLQKHYSIYNFFERVFEKLRRNASRFDAFHLLKIIPFCRFHVVLVPRNLHPKSLTMTMTGNGPGTAQRVTPKKLTPVV